MQLSLFFNTAQKKEDVVVRMKSTCGKIVCLGREDDMSNIVGLLEF